MGKRLVRIYYGDGKGKTTAALGLALKEASQGNSSIVIQCLKNKNDAEFCFLQKLEPEIKLFRFEKSEGYFEELSEEEKKEEIINIKNGMNFARKVLATGSCDLLILDEVLGLIDKGIITIEELKAIIDMKPEETGLVITGRNMSDELIDYADEIFKIEAIKNYVDNEIL